MRTLLLSLFPLLLYANISLQELKEAPKGHVRNFNIWQYLQQDITQEEAKCAYELTQGYNHKIFIKYAKKTDDMKIKEQARCSKLKSKALLHEDNATCVNRALSLSLAMNLKPKQREKLSAVLQEENAHKSELLRVMNNKPFVLSALRSGEKNYIALFNAAGSTNRHKYFNVKLPAERINALAKHKAFEKSIKYIVTDVKMKRMQASLLQLKAADLSAQSYFFLGLNALRFKATKKANAHFEIAGKKAYYQMDKDKALFWRYLISKDTTLLKALSQSSDINIYTLYAKEKLGLDYTNYFTQLELQNRPSQVNLKDPYTWEKILNEIRSCDTQALEKLLERSNSKEDEVLYAFIYSKVHKYRLHNFIMPYKEATQDLSKDDKALIYALARQESHFIPSAISRSYALGVMQMMPFLIKALAKQKHESPSLNDMFDPYKNIEYARKHLLYLKKHLYHPLFIAYAYNGGIGFTKRHLLKGSFTKGSFEPYLSMEMMANSESREYGKKVLANYIVYKKILGQRVSTIDLLESLVEPSRTDRFRTQARVLRP